MKLEPDACNAPPAESILSRKVTQRSYHDSDRVKVESSD